MASQDRFTGATLYFGYLADGLPAAYVLVTVVLTVLLAITRGGCSPRKRQGRGLPAAAQLSRVGRHHRRPALCGLTDTRCVCLVTGGREAAGVRTALHNRTLQM